MKHRYTQIVQSLWLYIPIFFLVNSFTFQYYEDELRQDQLHRLTWSSNTDEHVSERFQITLTGTPTELPTDSDYGYFEHTLFSYLNRQLNPRDIQISRVHVDQEKTKLKYNGYSGIKSFTVLLGGRKVEENKSDKNVENNEDTQNAIEPARDDGKVLEDTKGESKRSERELDNVGSSASKLIVEVDVEGRDFSGLRGHFQKHVKAVIDMGRDGIINELVQPADAKEYFKGLSWISVTDILSTGSVYGRTSGTGSSNVRGEDDRDDSSRDSEKEQEEKKDESKKEKSKTHKIRPMNAKAIEFRIISGSIFLSLCLTAVLSNTIRILTRRREERRRRLEKARQAYEAPKKAIINKGGSEKKFTGLLDDGDQYQ